VLVHLMPLSRVSAVPGAFGLACSVNAPPVECSTTVVTRPELVVGRAAPTAKQLVVVGHDTPLSVVSFDDVFAVTRSATERGLHAAASPTCREFHRHGLHVSRDQEQRARSSDKRIPNAWRSPPACMIDSWSRSSVPPTSQAPELPRSSRPCRPKATRRARYPARITTATSGTRRRVVRLNCGCNRTQPAAENHS